MTQTDRSTAHPVRDGKRNVLRSVGAAFMLTACSISPEPRVDPTTPASFSAAPDEASSDLAAIAWWKVYGDPALERLVERGFEANLDIKEANERIAAAAAIAGADNRLTSDLTLDGSDTVGNGPARSPLRGSAALVLDVFGGQAAARRRDDARLREAQAMADGARLAMTASVTSTYIDLHASERRVQLQQKEIESRRRILGRTRALLESGEVSRADVAEARALLGEAQADLPQVRLDLLRQQNALATLLAVPVPDVGTVLSESPAALTPPEVPTVGIPADLLRSRPDVRVAEETFLAAAADVGIARARVRPSLRLSGTVAVSGSSWSAGPVLDLPLFNQGQLSSQARSSEATARASYIAWQQAVFEAVEDVETALSAIELLGMAVSAAREASANFETVLRLRRELFAAGEIAVIDMLETERRAANARADVINRQRQFNQAYVTLMNALGAGSRVGGGPATP